MSNEGEDGRQLDSAESSYLPPVQPTVTSTFQSRRGPSIRLILIAVVALILVISGIIFGFASYNNKKQSNADATASSHANITATAHANANATAIFNRELTATAIATTYPFSSNLKLSDSLAGNNKGSGWQTDDLCKFQENAYHVVDMQANTFSSCAALNTDFSDFTFEVEAKLNEGDALGVTFRGNAQTSQFYRIAVFSNGSYDIYLYVDNTGSNAYKLASGNITPTPDLTGTNTISVVARGSNMAFYFNKTEVRNFTDTTYSNGQIGLTATDLTNSADAVFTNLKVWLLS